MGDEYFDDVGPIDWMIIEFPGGKEINGELVPPLLQLVDRHLIRVLDAVFLYKDDDGAVTSRTTEDLDPDEAGHLGALAGASSGLVDPEDALVAADAMENGASGVLVVYENLWALPFARAARRAGGQLVAGGRIPVQGILGRLEELGV